MAYPECDQYECEECPRQDECIDRDLDDLSVEPGAEDSFLDYVEQRFNAIERRLYALEKFKEGVERIVANATKSYEEGSD